MARAPRGASSCYFPELLGVVQKSCEKPWMTLSEPSQVLKRPRAKSQGPHWLSDHSRERFARRVANGNVSHRSCSILNPGFFES